MASNGDCPIDLLLAYYGDDFTGSTDALEQLVRGGVPKMLFIEPPTADSLARFPGLRAVGVASQARAMSAATMDAALPPAFAALADLQPRFVHYKVCSTFDSSPDTGSIGRAIDLGAQQFANRVTPLVVGAPSLGRYCVFGNLFARSGLDSPPFRLDRHPTMRRHPVTPMNEADLRLHLSRQTHRPVALIDVLAVERGLDAAEAQLALTSPGDIVLLDALSDSHLATIGRLLAQLQVREQKSQFVVGSSAIEAALTRHWQSTGAAGDDLASRPAAPVDRIVVVSGSCSPVTERQIAHAVARGFAEVAIDVMSLAEPSDAAAEVTSLVQRVRNHCHQGQSVIVHTLGGDRRPLASTDAGSRRALGATLGAALGQILRESIASHAIRRAVIAGGDTAGDVARALEIESLELAAPLEPGAPLCRVRSRFAPADGIELSFKGGQIGRDDFFVAALHGSGDV
ncbi:MAG TPA: four-carbon acid sugar kinase family protein [Lacipirellulaceae bacterium]|nr:four-carbon acid sugar kinase family protein [Lacipirellulaceae bacterium]